MTKDELVAALRLQKIPNIGDITAKKLIAHCGSPTAVFFDKMKVLTKIDGIGSFILKNLHHTAYLRAAEEEYEFVNANNILPYFFTESDYPQYLKHCVDGPILLFSKGELELNAPRMLSVVGTRNSTPYGERFCEELIEQLSPYTPTIISGFAYGIDICVQKAALRNGLQTIGCLGHGLNQIYPKAHQRYIPKIEQKGGFITEFWSTSHPDRENFLKRNRIIAGISMATVVIESAVKGGSLVTADIANSYNRDVFALPGRTTDRFSIGCNNLIKNQQAQLITSASDLVYLLGWDQKEQKARPIQRELFVELDETEKVIYTYLQNKGKQLLDDIALACSLPVFKTSSSLVLMEMKGVIRPLPGKLFEAI